MKSTIIQKKTVMDMDIMHDGTKEYSGRIKVFFVIVFLSEESYTENKIDFGGFVMSRKLVAYFSASGITARVAEVLSDVICADLFAIESKVPYTKADLDWMDKSSRSTIEMKNPASRPEIARKRDNMDEYDTIFVGFPIWWYVAPTIINTFLESYDLTGKTIIPFATSGGSGMGKTNEELLPSCNGSMLLEGRVFKPNTSAAELLEWVKALNI